MYKKFDSFIHKVAKIVKPEHATKMPWIYYLADINKLMIGSPINLVFVEVNDIDSEEDIAFQVYDNYPGINKCYHKLVVLNNNYLSVRDKLVDYYNKIENTEQAKLYISRVKNTTMDILSLLNEYETKFYKINDDVYAYTSTIKNDTFKVLGVFALKNDNQ